MPDVVGPPSPRHDIHQLLGDDDDFADGFAGGELFHFVGGEGGGFELGLSGVVALDRSSSST
jgi:hypothetical protein